jgi:RimJ/RimL family protein N-acetyltransferase
MQIPRLETDRLLLRELRESDFDNYARIHGDAETVRYLGSDGPLDRKTAWRSLAFFLGHWALRGFGMWAVQEKAAGTFVGRVGFHQPEGWPGFEIGWTIDRGCWGRGYATEAAKAALPLALSRYGRRHVISVIHPDNAASIRVAEKIGESFEREWELNGNGVLIYGMELSG